MYWSCKVIVYLFYYVYKITGALPAAKLHDVINSGIIVPAGIVIVVAPDSITVLVADKAAPYLNVTVEPVIFVLPFIEPDPKLCIPANEPVVDCVAVNITPPKFTGMFAILFFFSL